MLYKVIKPQSFVASRSGSCRRSKFTLKQVVKVKEHYLYYQWGRFTHNTFQWFNIRSWQFNVTLFPFLRYLTFFSFKKMLANVTNF